MTVVVMVHALFMTYHSVRKIALDTLVGLHGVGYLALGKEKQVNLATSKKSIY